MGEFVIDTVMACNWDDGLMLVQSAEMLIFLHSKGYTLHEGVIRWGELVLVLTDIPKEQVIEVLSDFGDEGLAVAWDVLQSKGCRVLNDTEAPF